MVARFTPRGEMDSTFASGGIALAPVPGDSETVADSTTATSFAGGKITLAWGTNGAGFDLFRYDLASASTVRGTVFNDLNGDGLRQKKEPGLVGVFVYEDLTNVGYYVVGDPATTTAENGSFRLTGLAPGAYAIRIGSVAGFKETHPPGDSGVEVSLFGGKIAGGLLFGEITR
jgi:hypothetical protein